MKKGFSIVLTPTDSSVSRHFFLSKKALIFFIVLSLVLLILVIFALIRYGALSYRTIETQLLKRRISEMEKEFTKLEMIKRKLEITEIENRKIKGMLGIDKTPSEIVPAVDTSEKKYEKVLNYAEQIENLPALLPVIGTISKKFDENHKGIDIAGALYSPVIAAGSGKVVSVGWDTLYGNYIVIEHSANYKTFYGHLHSILVKFNDIVSAGKVIGTLGSTGKSTSPHLHYEVMFKGQAVDPMAYLPSGVEKKGGL